MTTDRERDDAATGETLNLENRRITQASIRHCAMPAARIEDVDLSRSEFTNISFRGSRFKDVNLAGVSIENANIEGMTIFGHDIQALIYAEIARTRQ